MGYTDGGLFEVVVAQSGSLASVANIGQEYAPGYQPVTVRAVSVVLKVAAACAGAVELEKWATVGSSTGKSSIATITIPNGQAAGSVVYKKGLNVKVSPGESFRAVCTDAAGASVIADVTVLCEPSFEVPGNNSDMVESA